MNSKIRRLIKSFFYFFNINIRSNFKFIVVFKKNVFNKKSKKRVLISYLVDPFVDKNNFSHSNFLECLTAAEIFDELGFSVDVVDFNYNGFINYNKYEIIYGFGNPLENSFLNKNKTKKIFYSTGCNPFYSNVFTLLRIREFYKKNNILLLDSSRFVDKKFSLQVIFSDFVVVLGNDFVLKTYLNFDKKELFKYKKINAFFYDIFPDFDLNNRNMDEARYHFLWFGSVGAIHKGLDILLDVFSREKNMFLHVCGLSEKESGFCHYFKKVIANHSNIIDHGFVDIRSDEFKKILKICAFVIFPSVSEGGCVSVLNVMANGGLIPIITKSSGLDISDSGFCLLDSSKEEVENALAAIKNIDTKKLTSMSFNIFREIRTDYSYDNYKQNLKKILNNLL